MEMFSGSVVALINSELRILSVNVRNGLTETSAGVYDACQD